MHFPARAEVPEPDNLIYGVIQLGVTPVTGNDTNVFVEARKTSTNGPVVATYRMGESVIAGSFYSLRVPIEAFNPLTDTNASRVGGLLYLSVRDQSGVRVTRSASIAARGKLTRLDFTQPDSDGDGLPDSWEQQYFGNTTGADPNADPDRDGRSNLAEYLAGTDPLAPDGRHPADNSPANGILTFAEADAYSEAWLAGTPWASAPTNIPIAYVTRAGWLALNGGAYVFTNTPATNAPHWWVSLPRPATVAVSTHSIVSTMSGSVMAGQVLSITLHALPHAGAGVYAVEDQVPADWEVISISHGGSFDAVNHKVKWGPFYDSGERDLGYEVIPTAGSTAAVLSGAGSFDGLDVPISGNRIVTILSTGAPRWTSATLGILSPTFRLQGEASRTYVIEASTNLIEWSSLQTISTDSTGEYLFRPPGADQRAKQFYRVRTP